MKKNKILVIILIVLICATLAVTSVYALFSTYKKADGEIRIGKIEVELVEDWPEPGDKDPTDPDESYDEFGIKKYSKVVSGHSIGDLPAYVRIKCIPVVEYYDAVGEETGEWVTAPIPQEDILLSIFGQDWVISGDYYYYKKIINSLEDTGNLNINWQVKEIPSELRDYKLRTDVRVILEYAQPTNDVWKEVFKIQELPAGVEVYSQN